MISIPFGRLIGANPDAPIFQPGQGPIPDEVALQLLGNCELFVQVVSDTGITAQPLWLGRRKRNATINQYIALAVRDGGCVMCTAPPERCHSHHLMPWHAPGKGETNIDELVLLCPSCHVSLHERKLTLYRDEKSGQWATRPATKNETPPAPRPDASLAHRRPGRSSGRHEESGRGRSAPP